MRCFPVQVSVEGFKPSNQDDAFHAPSPKYFLISILEDVTVGAFRETTQFLHPISNAKNCLIAISYIWGHFESNDEADIYTLRTWQVCPPNDGTYEAIIVLYYAALNPYLTIKKHFGEDSAQEYLNRNAAITAIADALI